MGGRCCDCKHGPRTYDVLRRCVKLERVVRETDAACKDFERRWQLDPWAIDACGQRPPREGDEMEELTLCPKCYQGDRIITHSPGMRIKWVFCPGHWPEKHDDQIAKLTERVEELESVQAAWVHHCAEHTISDGGPTCETPKTCGGCKRAYWEPGMTNRGVCWDNGWNYIKRGQSICPKYEEA